jgi:hypothetical protein
MSVNLAPGPFGVGGQFFTSAGLPNNGGFIYTYAAGTTTPQATYTTSSGATPNANPITLSATGTAPQEIWLTAGIAYKFLVTDSLSNPIFSYTLDNILGINDFSSIPVATQWVASGLTPTFINTTSFALPGNQTGIFTANRRIQVVETSGTLTGVVTSSSFSTVTTVNVTLDSGGVVDSGISVVSYGINSALSTSIPQIIVAGSNIGVVYAAGIPTISNTAAVPAVNMVVNGSFAVNQRVTPPTTDNAYFLDAWRLALGAANAATCTQDQADLPIGAGFAFKLITGSGNNNKFGVFHPIENLNMLQAVGNVVSLRVPLKATANLANTRIGILQWTSTKDSISASPVSAWNATGTNPTLTAGWAYANTPVSLAVTTAWADYTIANVAISASATNLGIFIWNDSTTTTTTTDILHIGGYVTMTVGSVAPVATVARFADEFADCSRYYFKTFAYTTAPGQAITQVGAFQCNSGGNPSFFAELQFPTRLRAAPNTVTYNPVSANANWRDITNGADRTVAIVESTDRHIAWGSTTTSANASNLIHITSDASL